MDQSQIEQYTGAKENMIKAALRLTERQIRDFLGFSNDEYINFLRRNTTQGSKIIFDTNIYSPISYDWLVKPDSSYASEDLANRVFDKSYDYLDRLLDLLNNDARIVATQDIIIEMSRAPKSWKKG